jgi:hypothetical protein
MNVITGDPTLSWLPTLALASDYMAGILSLLSIAAIGVLLLTFGAFATLRTFAVKLISYLSISIGLALICFLLTFELANTPLCIPLAIGVHASFLANFTWSLVIGVNFYLMIVRRKTNCDRFERYYHAFAWLTPIVFVIGVGAAGLYGPIGRVPLVNGEEIFTACYITSETAVFFALTLPGVIVVTINIVLFVFIMREIHGSLAADANGAAPAHAAVPSVVGAKRRKRRAFRVYSSIFVSVGLPWVVAFIAYFFPTTTDYVRNPTEVAPAAVIIKGLLNLLYNIAVPMQGVLLFESYCFNKRVAGKWAAVLGHCVPWFRRFEHWGTQPNKR